MNTSYFRALAILAMFATGPVHAQVKTAENPTAEKADKGIDCANRHDHNKMRQGG